MLDRTNLINQLIRDNQYKSYLEIGYGAGINFKAVECEQKVSVDPFQKDADHVMTSDDFFLNNTQQFDIVFVDGLHLSYQVTNDVRNALLALLPGGVIVIHDCLPPLEENQFTERCTSNWQGDVWKAIVHLAKIGYKMELKTIETGIVLLWNEPKTYSIPDGELTWTWFQNNFKNMLCG